jgi:hypothetical protein
MHPSHFTALTLQPNGNLFRAAKQLNFLKELRLFLIFSFSVILTFLHERPASSIIFDH